jgi:cytochrome c-type biogenesis protein CcmH/NrfG
MTWAKAALAGGLLVLFTAFAIGTENGLSTSVMGQTQDCGPAISASWLVSGTPDQAQPGSAASDDQQRAAPACGPVIREARVIMLTIVGVGGLFALVGWTAVSARREAGPRAVTHAPA